MNAVRHLAAGLLFLSGLSHLATVLPGLSSENPVAGAVGAPYLVVVFYLLKKKAYYPGIVVPILDILIGLVLAFRFGISPSTLSLLWVAIDVVVIACCASLLNRACPPAPRSSVAPGI